MSALMDTTKPQDGQYHDYQPPNVIPMSQRSTPVTTFLSSLRSIGVPETVIDQARSVLSTVGVTDGSLNQMRETAGRGTRQTAEWSRKHPREAAGGLAAIVLTFGLILILMERRR